MVTEHQRVRLTATHWQALQSIARELVPDSEMPQKARRDAGRIPAMLRMIADGKLQVTVAEDVTTT